MRRANPVLHYCQ